METISPFATTFRNARNMEEIEKSRRFQEILKSIRVLGVLVPIQVYYADGEIVVKDGHRRNLAARILDHAEIPCITVPSPKESQLLLHQLAMNMTQENLDPMDQAKAFACIVNEYDVAQKDIAATIGKSPGYVSQHLGLLKLPPELQARVTSGSLAYRAAYVLSTLAPGEMGMKELESVTTVREAKARKRSIVARRSIVQTALEPVGIPDDLEEEQPGEHVALVQSLFQMAIDTVKRAAELASKSKIALDDWALALIKQCERKQND